MVLFPNVGWGARIIFLSITYRFVFVEFNLDAFELEHLQHEHFEVLLSCEPYCPNKIVDILVPFCCYQKRSTARSERVVYAWTADVDFNVFSWNGTNSDGIKNGWTNTVAGSGLFFWAALPWSSPAS